MIERLEAQMRAMQMLTRAQEVTADNLANINTPGFKGSKLFFHEFKQQIDGKEVGKTVPMQQIDLKQGVLEPTGNTFDFGIDGEGFFRVEEQGRQLLTRDGRFHVNSDGYLVNGQGANVLGTDGPVHIPEFLKASGRDGSPVRLEVAKDGTLRINGEVNDKLSIVKVDDAASLERRGNSYFSVTDPRHLTDRGAGSVMQGYYEKGNVEPLQEMVGMMRNMQMFESQQRAMRSTDEMLSQVSNRLGRF